MGAGALSTALLAHYVQPLFDDIFSCQNPTRLWPLATLILGIFMMKGWAGYGQMVLLNTIGQHIVSKIQQELFEHLVQGDITLFQKESSGKLISLLTYDTQLLRNGLTNTLLNMGRDALTLIFLVGVMIYKDAVLAGIALIGFPLIIWPIRSFGRKMRMISFGSQEAMGRLHSFFQQIFQGIRLVKAYGMEKFEENRAQEYIHLFLKLNLKGLRVRATLHPLMETVGGVAIVIVILYGGYQVIHHTKTTGSFLSFITALLLAYEPLKKLVHMNTELQEGLSALSRIFQMNDTPHLIKDNAHAPSLRLSHGSIDFKRITFGYPDHPPLFQDLSLSIQGGQRIAIVGPSGAGKSTLFNLLLRFYEPSSGSIEIDHQPLHTVNISSLRHMIGFVGQEMVLFNETVRDNILYGRPDALPQEVIQAATDAAAHEFIQNFPQGYAAQVGENGLKLSGGQRQRIAIARAMLKNAPILLLDEATSALDTQSEWQVQHALERLMRDKTTLIIAHRLSTVEKADHIFVLDQGKIVENGTHAHLMVQDGLYARLVVPQLQEAAA